ncbi:MAG: hypothetical protein LC725_12925, partial [Lentisphaerae bacterium]|nr:hypothetical protein [Lentisphaerota bacterium]
MRKPTWFLGVILTAGLLLGPCLRAQEQPALEDAPPPVLPEQIVDMLAEDAAVDESVPEPVGQNLPLADLTDFVSEQPVAPVVPMQVAPPRELYELPFADPMANGALAPPVDNLVSISLESVPVPDVVNMFSRISGANIIVAGTFTNLFITANLRNVEWKSALSLALGSVNLSMIEDPSGIIMVVDSTMYQEKLKQIEETKPLVTRSFSVRYMNAVDLAEQIKLLKILSPRGTIITSQSKQQHGASLKSSALTTTAIQNPSIVTELIVSDIKEYVDRVGQLIERLDRREKQVFIEARIVDVVTGDSQK